VITAFDLGNNVFTVALSEPSGHCSALIHTVHSSGIVLHKDHQSSLQRSGKTGGGGGWTTVVAMETDPFSLLFNHPSSFSLPSACDTASFHMLVK